MPTVTDFGRLARAARLVDLDRNLEEEWNDNWLRAAKLCHQGYQTLWSLEGVLSSRSH